MRKMVLAFALLCCLSVPCAPLVAATLYISDELFVPLRRGPSNAHKIIHKGLPSGTPLEVLGEDAAAGFTQVRMQNGTEGWVPTQFLSQQPAAKDRLAAANRRVETLETQLKTLRESYQEVRGAHGAVETRATELGKQTEQLQTELAEIRRVSANAVATHEENKQLKADNQSLQAQVTQLTERVRQLERNVMLRWLLAGGGLVLLGLILGIWLKSRTRRSGWA
jgi:SH3 domain protein